MRTTVLSLLAIALVSCGTTTRRVSFDPGVLEAEAEQAKEPTVRRGARGKKIKTRTAAPQEREHPIYDVAPAEVAISPKLASLIEDYSFWGMRAEVKTGELLARVFTGGSSASLVFVNSQADSFYAQVVTYGTTFIADYLLTVRLDTPGRSPQILTAHGLGQSYYDHSRAARQATEDAVYELYRQVGAILATSPTDSAATR